MHNEKNEKKQKQKQKLQAIPSADFEMGHAPAMQCNVGSLDRLITGTTAGGGAAGGVAPELPWMMRVRLATGAKTRLSVRHSILKTNILSRQARDRYRES